MKFYYFNSVETLNACVKLVFSFSRTECGFALHSLLVARVRDSLCHGVAAQALLKLCSLKGYSGFISLTAQMKLVIVICPRWPRVEDLLKISEGTDANQRNTSDRRRNGTGDNPLETRRAEDHADMTENISKRRRQRR